ncbi:putative SWI SNF complex subunit SMARCC2 [Rosellinia necatrix]|uniref:Putative SWI SNF complex subunit SMARCC2 n=1 Tax=Rosellinia necatrix TaxID=77044 RepID=A0A1S7UL91_ROSNE|nr:putative SWI SNF complex subunit SMARCC2 [Rosellinia necatrix]
MPNQEQTTDKNDADRNKALKIEKILAMFGKNSSSGFQGHAYIILQVIRFCNVAVLLAVMVASVLMLIFAKLPNGFQFFADIVHALVFFFAALLIYTEIGVWATGQEFVARAWPMLGPDRGFTGLGAIMAVIGCHLLGGLNSGTYTAGGVPSQIPQVIIGVGIVTITFGFTNIIASLVFKSNEVRARVVRQAGATVPNMSLNGSTGFNSRSNSTRKPDISGPFPMSTNDQFQPADYFPGDDKSMNSFDSRHSPIMPEISRPPTAMHPANRVTHYSEASHIDRFGNSMV